MPLAPTRALPAWLSSLARQLQVKYQRTGDNTFEKLFSYPNRPHAPWSYPQTGVGLPLPMFPPYDSMRFLAAGGSSSDRAVDTTPASDKVHVIEVRALPGGPLGWLFL